MEKIMEVALIRFAKYVKRTSTCHIWTGHKDSYGYGIFYYVKKQRKAHRFIYYATHGDIPDGMFVDHTCRRRACVNVKHLRVVTPRVNALENSSSVAAINAKRTHCKNGHAFDKKYGKQRYCSHCENEKSKRLQNKWLKEARKVKC